MALNGFEAGQKHIGKYVQECSEIVHSLREEVSSSNWQELDRVVFVNSLEKGISEMHAINSMLEKIQKEVEKTPWENAPDCTEIKNEFEKTISVLEKNLELEKAKKSRAKEIQSLTKDTHPELYASLQQKILSLLLKSSFLNERLTIFARKQSSIPLQEKSTGKQLLELLDSKETELQELKTKYNSIRSKSFMGLIEEKTASDLETDVSGLEKSIAKNYSVFEQSIANATSQMDSMQRYFFDAKEKFSTIRDSIEDYYEKSSELNKVLKKERDYAKKIALDIEHETMHLRGTYTKEMLSLQEAKISAKKEVEEKLGKRIASLEKQVLEKEGLVKHFKKFAEDRQEKEKKTEEELKQLKLLLRAKEKHDSVKNYFKKRTAEKNN